MAAGEEAVAVGTTVRFSKTVSEADVYLFAGITGDLGPNHTDAEYMRSTRYGQRVAHGALMVGYVSRCSTRLIEMLGDRPTVNYGYDRVRFVNPVFFGDTVTVAYAVESIDDDKGEIRAKATLTKQTGEVVAVVENILRHV